jgi:hypothetical protein
MLPNTNLPNPVIKDMYLEINSIAQGVNVGLLVLVAAAADSYSAFAANSFSLPVLALTNLLISITFWARYYFDTVILQRSYTPLSILWFFAYIVSQAVSISSIGKPVAWLLSTGVFLFFGFGFYVLNLLEIRRKQAEVELPAVFIEWQKRRMVELLVLSAGAFAGAALVWQYPGVALPAALVSLAAAVWQFALTNHYRVRRFISAGT